MLDLGCSILIPAHDLFTILYGTRKINCIMYTFTVSMKYRGEYLWLYKNNRFHMYKHKSKSNLDAWQFKNKNKLYFRCFEQQFFCENIHFVGWVVVCYTVVWTGWSSNFSSIHSPGSLFNTCLQIILVENSLFGKELNLFHLPNSGDDICLLFCLYPASMVVCEAQLMLHLSDWVWKSLGFVNN